MRWSIRWRLTVWNTAALALLLLGLAVLIYALLGRALVAGVDRTLDECWRQFEREPPPAEDEGRLRHWVEEFWEHEHIACVVFAADGRVAVKTVELAEAAVPPLVPAGEPARASGTLPVMGRQRFLSGGLPHARDGRSVVLLAGLAEVDHSLAQLRAVLLTAVPVMLGVSALVAYFLAGRALAPVSAISRVTRGITAEALDRRLPVVHPHDEVGELSTTINDMVARLERSFAEMKRFTADASHELRTPLAALRAEAELAAGKTLTAEESRHLLGGILEECDRLTSLTDQLLALAREDTGVAPARELLDLVALLAGVVETMRPLAEIKGLQLRLEGDGPANVRGDAARLRRVFYNLLDNAIKYTPAGSVEVRVARRGNDAVALVRDTGIGIAPEHLPHLFERFYRVDKARSREMGGAGLGLSIARSIVHAHGGRIELNSTPAEGTTCVVTLPVGEAV
jgi:heavy metal sensor kinase